MTKDDGSRTRCLIKTILSVWIIYHLFCIVFMPNSSSYLLRLMGDKVLPYANVLGLNTSWNFFSPDPAHIMYFQYNITKKNQDPNEESPDFFIPPEKNKGPFGVSERRIMYAMRFVIIDQRRVDSLLGPWICRMHPEAANIHVQHKIEPIPMLDNVIFDPENATQSAPSLIKMVDRDFNCQDLDEVSL